MNSKFFNKKRLPFLLGNIPILITCFDAWKQEDIVFLYINITVLLLNIFVLFFINKNFNQLAFVINAVFFFTLSYYYFELERVFLPYACILIGSGYIIVIVVINKKKIFNKISFFNKG